MTTNDFIDKCKNSGKFDDAQMSEILQGFKMGLTIDQVKVYCDHKFNGLQINKIRWVL